MGNCASEPKSPTGAIQRATSKRLSLDTNSTVGTSDIGLQFEGECQSPNIQKQAEEQWKVGDHKDQNFFMENTLIFMGNSHCTKRTRSGDVTSSSTE